MDRIVFMVSVICVSLGLSVSTIGDGNLYQMGVRKVISPTGQKVRNDVKGMGSYGTSRGDRIHEGTDYLCTPGQSVVAPISGKVTRLAYPYNDRSYGGLVIQGSSLAIKLFYIQPNSGIVGREVKQGEAIATAQDISERYSIGMKPHVHLEITSLNPEILISML